MTQTKIIALGLLLSLCSGCSGEPDGEAEPKTSPEFTQVGYFKDSGKNRILAYRISGEADAATIRAHAESQMNTPGQMTAVYYWPEGTDGPGMQLTRSADLFAANDLLASQAVAPWSYAAMTYLMGTFDFVDCEAVPANDLCKQPAE